MYTWEQYQSRGGMIGMLLKLTKEGIIDVNVSLTCLWIAMWLIGRGSKGGGM